MPVHLKQHQMERRQEQGMPLLKISKRREENEKWEKVSIC